MLKANTKGIAFVTSWTGGQQLRGAKLSADRRRSWRYIEAPRKSTRHIPVCKSSAEGNTGSSLVPSSNVKSFSEGHFKFKIVRGAIFSAMALTYATYVMLRATFTYTAPVMASSLHLNLQSIGEITSAFPIAYGLSRLFTGVIVDRAAPHVALATGLFLAGLVNVAMGSVTTVSLLAFLWGLNGLVQGVGAGSSAKMLLNWFSPEERGFFWALWSTSANVGGFLAPIVCGWLASTRAGFRAGMAVPGAFAMALAFLTLIVTRSSPRQMGFLTRWEPRTVEKKSEVEQTEKESWKQAFIEGVLKNRMIWTLAISYFFVYFVRAGMKSWLQFWLLDVHTFSATEAAYRVSGVEVGGIAGTFSAGIVSDWANGRRAAVTIVYLLGLAVSLVVTWLTGGRNALWDFLTMAIMGFMINGPQMMIGLIGAEVADKRVVGTANGMLGLISYLGAAASGVPLAFIIQKFKWSGFFCSLLFCSLMSVLCLAPLWKLKAQVSAKNG
ncbi:Sugar phosphate transporter [Gracilaria domingensis]|nr:Sugar phosphate transporter [Gracilaria domingensis]